MTRWSHTALDNFAGQGHDHIPPYLDVSQHPTVHNNPLPPDAVHEVRVVPACSIQLVGSVGARGPVWVWHDGECKANAAWQEERVSCSVKPAPYSVASDQDITCAVHDSDRFASLPRDAVALTTFP